MKREGNQRLNWERSPTCVLECQTDHTRLQVQSGGTLGPGSWPLIFPHLFYQPQEGRQSTEWGPSGCFSAAWLPSIPALSSSIFPWHNDHYPAKLGLLECPDDLSSNPTATIWAHGAIQWRTPFHTGKSQNSFLKKEVIKNKLGFF